MQRLRSLAIKHWPIFPITLIVVILSLIRFSRGEVQQDNYIGYAISLKHGLKDLSLFDTRLFPGLPILIYLFGSLFAGNFILAGYLIIFLAFIGSYILLHRTIGSRFSFFSLVFPPIMLSQATLVATEYPFIFFILLAVNWLKAKKYPLAFVALGLSVWFRPAGAVAAAAVLFYLLLRGNMRAMLLSIPYFLLPVISLGLYFSFFFGISNIFLPLISYANFAKPVLGIVQLALDLPRAVKWGWYRIFLSGTFYLVFYIALLLSTLRDYKKKQTAFRSLVLLIILFMSAFVFLLGFVPELENLGRFFVPIFPLFWMLLYEKFGNPILPFVLIPISFLVVFL